MRHEHGRPTELARRYGPGGVLLGLCVALSLGVLFQWLCIDGRVCKAGAQGNSSWQPYSAATVLQAAPDVEPACVQPVPDPASRRPPVWQGTLAQDTHTVNLVRSDGALWLDEASAEAKAGCLRETFFHGTHLIELDYFSRHGEDGILAAVFRCIGHRDKQFVELASPTCQQCTSRFLRSQGWLGVTLHPTRIEAIPNVRAANLTAAGAADTLRSYANARSFDHLTASAGGHNFWVLHALLLDGFRPRVIAAKINRALPPYDALAVDPAAPPDIAPLGAYFGASLYAYKLLFDAFGYALLGIDTSGANAYAVQQSELSAAPLSYEEVLAAPRRAGRLCWASGVPVRKGPSWVLVRSQAQLRRTRVEMLSKLRYITLEQFQVFRRDGTCAQVFHGFEWRDIERTDPAARARHRFESGCL